MLKRRACVIVGVPADDKLEVVYVQEKPAPKCTVPLPVAKASPLGLIFPLTKDSYFTGYQLIRTKMVADVCMEPGGTPALCPWSKYAAIEAVAAERKRQLVQRQQALAMAKAHRAAPPPPPATEPPTTPSPADPKADDDDVA